MSGSRSSRNRVVEVGGVELGGVISRNSSTSVSGTSSSCFVTW